MIKSTLARIAQNEDLNFLLTNRIPRHAATRFMGWFGKISHPLVRDASIGIWRLFADPDLGLGFRCFTQAAAATRGRGVGGDQRTR